MRSVRQCLLTLNSSPFVFYLKGVAGPKGHSSDVYKYKEAEE